MNKIHVSKWNPLLIFIPAVNMVTNFVHHDRDFWGIRFPVRTSSFHQSIVDIIEKYLKGSRHPVLNASLQWLYLAMVVNTIIIELYGKLVEHDFSL